MFDAYVLNLGFALAALFSVLTFAVHTFVGTREVAVPLLASELKTMPKYTNYYCWHLVTLMLFLMSLGFCWAALLPEAASVGLFLTIEAAGCFAWSLLMIFQRRLKLWLFPQWLLFLPIAIAGLVGGWPFLS